MKELLDVPEGYEVLFLGGGASLQFAQVPMNLLKKKAAYVDSGTWANKAAKEAKASVRSLPSPLRMTTTSGTPSHGKRTKYR